MENYEIFDGSAFKVTEQEYAEKTIVGMPDVPGLSAEDMQRRLEEYTDFLAKEKLNGLIDRLGDAENGVPTARGMQQAINEAAYGEAREETVFEYIDATLPDAEAVITGTTLDIQSANPRKGTDYDVQFVMPSGTFDSISIDGTVMTALLDSLGEETELTAAEGVPVRLTRQGDRAFFKTGGGKSMPLAGGTFTGPVYAIADDRSESRLMNAKVETSAGAEVSTSWLRFRR